MNNNNNNFSDTLKLVIEIKAQISVLDTKLQGMEKSISIIRDRVRENKEELYEQKEHIRTNIGQIKSLKVSVDQMSRRIRGNNILYQVKHLFSNTKAIIILITSILASIGVAYNFLKKEVVELGDEVAKEELRLKNKSKPSNKRISQETGLVK